MFADGRDAAFPSGIGSDYSGVVGGYFGGPNAYHVWPASAWLAFRSNPKVPIWVAGYGGEPEAKQALPLLGALGVPAGSVIAVDMETRIDETYLRHFGSIMQGAGFKVLVYGSLSTVFRNIQLNGYWVADYTGMAHMAINPDTGDSLGVRGTQWTAGKTYDTSAWKAWTLGEMWH